MSSVDTLSGAEVHIWPFPLFIVPEKHSTCFSWLSEEERTRADSFSQPHLKNRFMAGRGMLRSILAQYLGKAPAAVEFSYTAYGKPFLRDEAKHGFRFNLSHSEDHALLAVARGRAIGVDLEHIRPDFATLEIAGRFFSEHEFLELSDLSESERATAFFRCWTRKEAFIKAVGEGLSFPLNAFAVSLAPREPAELRWLRDDPAAVHRWQLRDLPAPPGYLAALAVEGNVEVILQPC